MSLSRMWWMAKNFAADMRSAVRAAFLAFREDLALSRFNRAVEQSERDVVLCGEWYD